MLPGAGSMLHPLKEHGKFQAKHASYILPAMAITLHSFGGTCMLCGIHSRYYTLCTTCSAQHALYYMLCPICSAQHACTTCSALHALHCMLSPTCSAQHALHCMLCPACSAPHVQPNMLCYMLCAQPEYCETVPGTPSTACEAPCQFSSPPGST
jgi:hypothetical protein